MSNNQANDLHTGTVKQLRDVRVNKASALASTATSPSIDELANQTRRVSIDLTLLDSVVQKVMSNNDLWVLKILPFLGPGHYLYVALVCKRFKELYLAFIKTIKRPPMVVNTIWHHTQRPGLANNTFYSAAFSSVSCAKFWDKITKGDINRFKNPWGHLYKNDPGPTLGIVCATIAKHGCLPVLKWARAQNFPWDENTCRWAAKGGHLEVLKWARENECPWNDVTCTWAAEGGHLEILKWAREHDCPWNKYTCKAAAKGGHLEVLKWARENNCPWDGETCKWAAQRGDLEMLKWAREKDCPLDHRICVYAAGYGHLEVLKWARENDCHWDTHTCVWAAWAGHLEVLKWARENGCPWVEEEVRAAAEKYHRQEILDWLDILEN